MYWHFQIHGWKLMMECFFCCMLVHRNSLCGTVSHDVFCGVVCGLWSISTVLKGISLISNAVWTSYIIWSAYVLKHIQKYGCKVLFHVENIWRTGLISFRWGLKGWSTVDNVACEIVCYRHLDARKYEVCVCINLRAWGFLAWLTT